MSEAGIPTLEALRIMGGNPMASQKRELSDSDRERVQGIRSRLTRRILFPRAFDVNVVSDVGFLLELIDRSPFPAGNAEQLPGSAAKMKK